MAIASTTGAKIYIGPVTAAATVSAYAALSYTEIKNVESISEFGDQAAAVNFTSLSDSRVRKRKGVKDAGDITVVCGHDPLDPGQLAVLTAEGTDFAYAIKVVLADGADANDTDSTFYFHALVMSERLNIGSANEIIKRNFVLAIDTAVLASLSTAVS
jgi:hypothetical protein